MAGAAIHIGIGSTITFGTSTYTALLTGLSWSGLSRDILETTAMATDLTPGATTFGNATYRPVSIVDGGEVTAEVYFNPDLTPPMVPATVANSEVITIAFPIVGAESAPSWAFSGYCKGFEANCPLEDLMTATLVIRVTAGVTKTEAA